MLALTVLLMSVGGHAAYSVRAATWRQDREARPVYETRSGSEGNIDGYYWTGEVAGDKAFKLLRQGRSTCNIMVYAQSKLILIAPDPELNILGQTLNPGQTYGGGYEFYLSPQCQYLFVIRHISVELDAAYLFKHTRGKSMALVNPMGMRVDDAAVAYYARVEHVSADRLGSQSRIVRFVGWTRHGSLLKFDEAAASYVWNQGPRKGDISAEWISTFDPTHKRFRLIRRGGNILGPWR